MALRRPNHIEREQMVLDDLVASFPNCSLSESHWSAIPENQDPPDFTSEEPNVRFGLEFVEWLDGEQMKPAKTRERQRDQFARILKDRWEEFRPKHFIRAFVAPQHKHVSRADEASLRMEFYDCAADVDHNWVAYTEHHQQSFYQNNFDSYPRLRKYVASIRYIGGQLHGSCWIGMQPDGGAYDPSIPAETLKHRLNEKLLDYSTAEKQAHFRKHKLSKLLLLVHGGSNAFIYNTPSGLLLEEIADLAATFYGQHPQRQLFDEVWFFNSLSSSEEAYRDVHSTRGRSRFLAKLWPKLVIVTS